MLIYDIPPNWRYENIAGPSILCRDKTETVIYALKKNYNLKPINIEAILGDSLIVSYFNENNFNTLRIEIYNNLEISALIINEKECETIHVEAVYDLNFENVMKKFFEPTS